MSQYLITLKIYILDHLAFKNVQSGKICKSENPKQPKCSSSREWIKLWRSHNEYNTAVKITSLEQYSATLTNLSRNDLSKKQVTE